MKSVALILLLVIGGRAEDVGTSSGDGEDLLSTTEYASLINDVGDIENVTAYDLVLSTNETVNESASTESASTESTSTESTSIESTSQQSSSWSTESTFQKSLSTEDINDSPTTTEASTTAAITTESDTLTDLAETLKITTSIQTSATNQTTIQPTTNQPTTNQPATNRPTTPMFTFTMTDETGSSRIPTTYAPPGADDYCSLVDSDLTCEEEIVCFGDGIVDCNEPIESGPAKTTFTEKMSSSSVADEYSEYEAVEEVIETFPPYLVGVKSSKKSLFFKTGSLGTKYSEEETETTPSYFLEPSLRPTNSGYIDIVFESTFKTSDAVDADSEDPSSTTTLTFDVRSPPDESVNDSKETETTFRTNTTEDPLTTPIRKIVEHTTEASLHSTNDTAENSRKKREEPFRSMSLNADPTESGKACRIVGNLICTPTPTHAKCRGKAACRVLSNAAETSEKSTSPKGVETWAIAVIAICAIAAAFTVSLLLYLVFTSWKKLKVQPQNGVTTLTYVNSTMP